MKKCDRIPYHRTHHKKQWRCFVITRLSNEVMCMFLLLPSQNAFLLAMTAH